MQTVTIDEKNFKAKALLRYFDASSLDSVVCLMSTSLVPKSMIMAKSPVKESANENLPKFSLPRYLAINITNTKDTILNALLPKKVNPVFLTILLSDDIIYNLLHKLLFLHFEIILSKNQGQHFCRTFFHLFQNTHILC